ncbi:MAG: hypothetical protein EA411_01810 [Saprospirales bacterium]|nr:MAG: hypothetical protein EA411_01810 [Saprospirales bacterium]
MQDKKISLMKPLLIIALLLSSLHLSGQIGVTAAYNNLNFNPDEVTQAGDLSFTGYSLSANYWFRMNEVRVEFLPGFSHSQLESDLSELKMFQFFTSVRVYPFSFWDDCDCPTFSKQSGFFEDGFFLSLIPYLNRYEMSMLDDELYSGLEFEDWAFSLDVGAGLDIGLSDFFTLTPEVRYRYYPNIAGFMPEPENGDLVETGNLNGLYAGMSLTFRWRH